jgi:heme/copper-type cytochrome/quinol oxidase subunit 1
MPRRSAIGEAPYTQLLNWGLANQLTALGGIVMGISGLLFFVVTIMTLRGGKPVTVDVPVSAATIGAGALTPQLDRLGRWFGLAALLAALAYVPVFIALRPWNRLSVGQVVWGQPFIPAIPGFVIYGLYALVFVAAFVALWRKLQSSYSVS